MTPFKKTLLFVGREEKSLGWQKLPFVLTLSLRIHTKTAVCDAFCDITMTMAHSVAVRQSKNMVTATP
jgi:hypothetical protein